MKDWLVACTVLAVLNCGLAFGQQPAPQNGESHKNRTIFTIVGGGGGFGIGIAVGLAAFDDAINSDRKVWTTAVFSGVGGAVGGYFLGRALDKRTKKTNVTSLPDDLTRSLILSQWSNLPANRRSHLGPNPNCDSTTPIAHERFPIGAIDPFRRTSGSCSALLEPRTDATWRWIGSLRSGK